MVHSKNERPIRREGENEEGDEEKEGDADDEEVEKKEKYLEHLQCLVLMNFKIEPSKPKMISIRVSWTRSDSRTLTSHSGLPEMYSVPRFR